MLNPVHSLVSQAVCSRGEEHHIQGRTVVSPYVGMAQKQDGGSNGCISIYYGDNSARNRFYMLLSTYLSFSSAALANKNISILPEISAKVANRELGKM